MVFDNPRACQSHGTSFAPLIDFQDVTVVKGGKKVLRDVCLRILPGEHVAILGPNGAGKTSLIKTVTREYYPIERVNGFTCQLWGKERWNIFDLQATLGIVSGSLQDAFTRDTTGLEVVLSGFFSSIGIYHQRVTAAMRRKANNILKFLDMAHLKDRKMTQMSSGEARRLLIGRALVHGPKALILDEPFNSLDLFARHKFEQALNKIAHGGVGVIIVTHNLLDIIPVISRVVLIRKGRIFKDGRKESVLIDEHMRQLFQTPAKIKKINGYYFAL